MASVNRNTGPIAWYRRQGVTIKAAILGGIFMLLASVFPTVSQWVIDRMPWQKPVELFFTTVAASHPQVGWPGGRCTGDLVGFPLGTLTDRVYPGAAIPRYEGEAYNRIRPMVATLNPVQVWFDLQPKVGDERAQVSIDEITVELLDYKPVQERITLILFEATCADGGTRHRLSAELSPKISQYPLLKARATKPIRESFPVYHGEVALFEIYVYSETPGWYRIRVIVDYHSLGNRQRAYSDQEYAVLVTDPSTFDSLFIADFWDGALSKATTEYLLELRGRYLELQSYYYQRYLELQSKPSR